MNPLASWQAYFQAQAGAAAALTGLLFVALSFNLDRIAAEIGTIQSANETLTGYHQDRRARLTVLSS